MHYNSCSYPGRVRSGRVAVLCDFHAITIRTDIFIDNRGEMSEISVALQTLQAFVDAVNSHDHVTAIALYERSLDTIDSYPKDIQDTLRRLYVEALLQGQMCEKAVSIASKCKALTDLYAYALYKQNDYKQAIALAKLDVSDSTALRILMGQALYHVADTKGSIDVFQSLIEGDLAEEDKVQLFTNLISVLFADVTPYCQVADSHRDILESASDFIQNFHGDDYPYDLAFGLASCRLLTTANGSERKPWVELLQNAILVCQNQQLSDEELTAELGPLQMNLYLLSRVLWNQTANTDTATDVRIGEKAPTNVQHVNSANRALCNVSSESLKVLLQDPDASMSILQKRLWYYNRAVIQLRAGKHDDCMSTCHFLQNHILQQQKGNKKKRSSADDTSSLVVDDPVDQLWWDARIAVLIAHCYMAKENGGSRFSMLDECIEKCKALPPTNRIRDHTLTFLMVHKLIFVADSDTSNMNMLQELSSNLATNKPALVTTIASLYLVTGNESKAAETLKDCNDKHAAADFAMAQGNYGQAADLYKSLTDDDDITKAQLIRALSYTDPEKALELWSEISPDLEHEDNDINVVELEAKELPRNLLTSTQISRHTGVSNSNIKTKNHDAVLRRRARKREEYVAALKAKGNPNPPNPERWLPKHERSTNRRRNNKTLHRGAQGGVSEKDAAKLDIVARQAARAERDVESSRSTAHMTVSNGDRKGKASKRR